MEWLDRMNVKETYSIGEQDPWRLTKESGYRLALAICKTGAEVIAANVDTTCPPTHVCVRLRIEQSKVPVFIEHFQDSLDAVEVAMGQRSNGLHERPGATTQKDTNAK